MNEMAAPLDDACLFLCASLSDQIERKRSFSSCFSDANLFRFVDSVDGRSWSEEQADEHFSQNMKALRTREREKGLRWISPPAIACALTHRDGLLFHAQSRSLILCEDDILIAGDFIQHWRDDELRKKMNGLDGVVLLHYFSRTPIVGSGSPLFSFGKYGVYEVESGNVVSGACYFAPQTVAHSIRLAQNPIETSADHWVEMKRRRVFSSIFVVSPSPCRVAGLASNIGYGGDLNSNALWVVWARRLKRMFLRSREDFYETLKIK